MAQTSMLERLPFLSCRALSGSLFLLLLSAACAFSQPFSFGLKAGVPLTNFLGSYSSPNFAFEGVTNPYIIGPTIQVNLPFGLAVEADGLYRHFHYATSGNNFLFPVTSATYASARGSAWEIPLLGKYRFGSGVARPFVESGIAWDRLAGLSETISYPIGIFGQPPVSTGTRTTSNPNELRNRTVTGFVAGGGIDIRALFLHIAPEIRYTHWGSEHFQVCLLDSCQLNPQLTNQNQWEFLLGVTF